MSSQAEENMALARRFMEARVKGDLEAMDEMMASDFVSRTSLLSVQEPTREGQIWEVGDYEIRSVPSMLGEHSVPGGSMPKEGFEEHHEKIDP